MFPYDFSHYLPLIAQGVVLLGHFLVIFGGQISRGDTISTDNNKKD